MSSCDKWLTAHLPSHSVSAADAWSFRCISSPVSTSAFQPASSQDSLDDLSAAHRTNSSRALKSVRWKENVVHGEDCVGLAPPSESESTPCPLSARVPTVSALSSALKFSTSFEGLNLSNDTSAPYYPNRRVDRTWGRGGDTVVGGATDISGCDSDDDEDAVELDDNDTSFILGEGDSGQESSVGSGERAAISVHDM